uniref:DUF5901 domain-containing protein n=1 Tax=viral metagenome TaxID=1070528 RepID=A0A6C0K5K3_9ZZZZ
MAETSSGQHVLMKDQTKIKQAVRQTTIVVNSRDRNFLNYPNSNFFRYTLRRPLTNVMSIELTNGSIPSYIYNIQATWGSFSLTESANISVDVTLTPGFYTEAQLLAELEAQLNAIPGRLNTYTVTQKHINGRNTRFIQVTGTRVEFLFQFYTTDFRDELDLNTLAYMAINSPARLLGFGFDDYVSGYDYSQGNPIPTPSNPYTLIGVLPMDLSNFLSRIYLHIEADGRNLDRMECGVGRKDCFHIFYIQNGQTDYTLLDKQTDHSIFVSKPSPISRIANLQISIRDEFGRPLNLNMRELSLVFEITHLE